MPLVAGKDLKMMKRSELQKLAKQHGVKANKKTEDIMAELQRIFEQNAESEESEKSPTTSIFCGDNTDSQVETPRSCESANSTMDLMAVKPPWNDSDITASDSTPQQDHEGDTFGSPSTGRSSKAGKGRQTRSLSRNTTPRAAATGTAKANGRTFSVERSKTKIATTKTLKKRSTNATTDGTKTPTAAATMPAKPNNKTFSVERRKTKPRSADRNDTAAIAKKTKKRSISATADTSPKPKKRRSDRAGKSSSDCDEAVDENLKNEILEEIRKKIAESDENLPKKAGENSSFTTKIPRFNVPGVTIGASKTITPGNKDWNKIHSKGFGRLESIDDYEMRKKERAERLLGSNQKSAKHVSRLAQPSRRGKPRILKPVVGKGRPLPSFASPAPGEGIASKTPRSIMKTQQKTPKVVKTSTFKPTVTSTSKMNLNFARKTTKAATPKRVTIVSDQGGKGPTYVKTPATGMRNKSLLRTPAGEKRKSVVGTPKTPTTSLDSTTTPGGTKKPVFDLKKSLQKPLTWAAHKGPLRPFNDTAKKPSFQDRMKDIKKPSVQSRDKRKQKMAAEKRQANDRRMMRRRGIE